jgi:predicted DNA-binding protein
MVQVLNAESANPHRGPGIGRVMKRKICVYVSEELVTRLATAAEKRGATKSGLVGSALDRFLDIREDHDTSSSVDERLVRMGDQLDHLARELSVVNETVAMHARYHLAVTPALSDTEQPTACRLGAARFDEFAAQVARRVKLGKPLFHETLERLEAQAAPLPSSDDESISGASAERAHDAINNRLGETDRERVAPGIARQISDEQAADGDSRRRATIEVAAHSPGLPTIRDRVLPVLSISYY